MFAWIMLKRTRLLSLPSQANARGGGLTLTRLILESATNAGDKGYNESNACDGHALCASVRTVLVNMAQSGK